MDKAPEWEPNPNYQSPKVALSEVALRGEEEEPLSPEEYGRRQQEAEQRVRRELVQYWKKNGERALRERRERLEQRKEEAREKEEKLLRKRAAADAATRGAHALGEQYGSDAKCGESHFTNGGGFVEQTLDGDRTVHWHRTDCWNGSDSVLLVLTAEEEYVFRASLNATFERLCRLADVTYRRLERPWLRSKKHSEHVQLRAAVCESLLMEMDLYGEPQEDRECASEETEYQDVPESVSERKPQAPYLCAYHLGQLLEERSWPQEWEPTTLTEVEKKFGERYDHHTGKTSLRKALQREHARYDGDPFAPKLGEMSDAARQEKVRAMCRRCHSYYKEQSGR
jgi:hypothetical protein